MAVDLVTVGVSGLNAAKKGLEVTSHNVANARTPGFSRQRVLQETSHPVSQAGFTMGTGTDVKRIERLHDNLLEARLNNNITEEEMFREKLAALEQLESVFNQGETDGLDKIFGAFFNTFRELSLNPENEALRSMVRDQALTVTRNINTVDRQLLELNNGIEERIIKNVNDLNDLLDGVSDLNQRIAASEVRFEEANDLRDRRDQLVKEVAKLLAISTFEDNGSFVIYAENLGTLVAGPVPQKLEAIRTDHGVEIVWKDARKTIITPNLKNGTISGLFQVRDTTLKNTREGLDQLAYTLVKNVNAIHRKGYVYRDVPIVEGRPLNFDKFGKTTDIDFFKDLNNVHEAARLIDLSTEIKKDLSNLATAYNANQPGDNRVALDIAKLDGKKLINNGQATLEEHYLKLIGAVGTEVGRAQIHYEQATGIRAQAEAIKERVSGVSIDEETTNIMRYQQGYEAAAKVLKTAQETMDTILSLK